MLPDLGGALNWSLFAQVIQKLTSRGLRQVQDLSGFHFSGSPTLPRSSQSESTCELQLITTKPSEVLSSRCCSSLSEIRSVLSEPMIRTLTVGYDKCNRRRIYMDCHQLVPRSTRSGRMVKLFAPNVCLSRKKQVTLKSNRLIGRQIGQLDSLYFSQLLVRTGSFVKSYG